MPLMRSNPVVSLEKWRDCVARKKFEGLLEMEEFGLVSNGGGVCFLSWLGSQGQGL